MCLLLLAAQNGQGLLWMFVCTIVSTVFLTDLLVGSLFGYFAVSLYAFVLCGFDT